MDAFEETSARRDARLAWWREARFGMFVHWGVYSLAGGEWGGKRGERNGWNAWIMRNARVSVADYEKFAAQFNPVRFDAEALVRLARRAGMKYIVITTKHHDGFAMFHSRASKFNLVDATPFKRDPIRELADACHRAGMPLGFYYSQGQDWYHPGGGCTGEKWDPRQAGRMEDYIKTIAAPQVRELLSNYGPVALFWWDTPYGMNDELSAILREELKLQPRIITNNRLNAIPGMDYATPVPGHPPSGDYYTPEQRIPFRGLEGLDWEDCMTMNGSWGYNSADHNWKPGETLLRNLIDIVGKGGNYLLNVGPDGLGDIPLASIESLETIGAWLAINGESIYGAGAGPLKNQPSWGRVTAKPGRLYAHVFFWPENRRLVVPVSARARRAYLIEHPGQPIAISSTSRGLELKLPVTATDPIASVIVIETDGDATALPPSPIKQTPGRTLRLPALAVEPAGMDDLSIEGHVEPVLRFWKSTRGRLEWTASMATPGDYEAVLTCSVRSDCAGSQIAFECAGQTLPAKVPATKGSPDGWDDYQRLVLGTVKIEKAGLQTISLRLVKPAGRAGRYGAMNLRGVELIPVSKSSTQS